MVKTLAAAIWWSMKRVRRNRVAVAAAGAASAAVVVAVAGMAAEAAGEAAVIVEIVATAAIAATAGRNLGWSAKTSPDQRAPQFWDEVVLCGSHPPNPLHFALPRPWLESSRPEARF